MSAPGQIRRLGSLGCAAGLHTSAEEMPSSEAPAPVAIGSRTGRRGGNIAGASGLNGASGFPSRVHSVMNHGVRILSLLMLSLLIDRHAMSATVLECRDKIAPSLVEILTKTFPGLRIPQLRDLDHESIDHDLADGGDGCFAVANGDFEGTGRQGSVMLLVPRRGQGAPQLVVALPRSRAWKVYRLPTFCDSITFCYVKTERPGTYHRSAALDSPPARSDERVTLTTTRPVVLSGRLESTGIVYGYFRGRWLYVWVSD
jgi:hypothetical protein